MRAARVYRSYEEFERDELRRLDTPTASIDEMVDEMFAELDFDSPPGAGRKRSALDDE